jgi:hypothetical protein
VTDTSTNTLALPYLQSYREVTALALAYLALVDDMTERPPQVATMSADRCVTHQETNVPGRSWPCNGAARAHLSALARPRW